MKIFTKLLLTTCVISSSYTFAQQDSISITKISSPVNNNYSFDGDWKISNNSTNNNFIINGSKITNNSKKTSNTLFLNLYFIPSNSNLNLNNLPNQISKNVVLGKLEGRGTSFNNIYVSFKDQDIKNLKKDNYIPLLVLKEQETNKILNYKLLNDRISLEDDNIYINNQQLDSAPIAIEKVPAATQSQEQKYVSSEVSDPKLFDDYTTVESSLNLENVNNNLKFQGAWQLSVDFEKLSIDIIGKDNRIVNSNSKATNDLKLLIYFSKENIKHSNSVDGYEFANIDLPPIAGHFMIKEPTYKTNITKLLPPGEYYPTLAIVEKNDKGEYVLRSTIALGEKYIWK
ncbi:hypothetical protein [Chishuiella sp.]|uniref:hypothetical protein n=1 Tax=Chishuiella sp. TaxID=1969467 RepID=UPI0028AD32F9|nr:hypothetical protein [Chishuiella sp.]